MFYIKKYFKFIIFFICLIIVGVGGFFCSFLFDDKSTDKDDIIAYVEESTLSSSSSNESNNFYIDIKGEVKKPGVYFVSEGMIVEDAITLAGGLTKNAYTDNINLSLKLSNEMVIYIYNKKDITTVPITTKILNDAVVTSSNIVSKSSTSFETTVSSLININTATKEEILTLPGIGESKADKIIAYRESNKFNSIEDIKNVSGIGDSLFESIKDFITV